MKIWNIYILKMKNNKCKNSWINILENLNNLHNKEIKYQKNVKNKEHFSFNNYIINNL